MQFGTPPFNFWQMAVTSEVPPGASSQVTPLLTVRSNVCRACHGSRRRLNGKPSREMHNHAAVREKVDIVRYKPVGDVASLGERPGIGAGRGPGERKVSPVSSQRALTIGAQG